MSEQSEYVNRMASSEYECTLGRLIGKPQGKLVAYKTSEWWTKSHTLSTHTLCHLSTHTIFTIIYLAITLKSI